MTRQDGFINGRIYVSGPVYNCMGAIVHAGSFACSFEKGKKHRLSCMFIIYLDDFQFFRKSILNIMFISISFIVVFNLFHTCLWSVANHIYIDIDRFLYMMYICLYIHLAVISFYFHIFPLFEIILFVPSEKYFSSINSNSPKIFFYPKCCWCIFRTLCSCFAFEL